MSYVSLKNGFSICQDEPINICIGKYHDNPDKDTIYIGNGYKRVVLFDGDQEIDLIATIKYLTTKVEELQTHIDYMPGGQGYYEAKTSFELSLIEN